MVDLLVLHNCGHTTGQQAHGPSC